MQSPIVRLPERGRKLNLQQSHQEPSKRRVRLNRSL